VATPSEEVRLRLIRSFTPTVTNALESLYPRLTNALDWASANEPEPNILSHPPGPYQSPATKSVTKTGLVSGSTQMDASGASTLPRMSKFILVASYIASTNPSKTDLRMFGRGLDEKKRKRRAVKTRNKTMGPSKVVFFSP
jgi:origin recognition complex subunit 5